MPKNFSIIADICEKISKYLIYAAVAITPILFLPWTTDMLDFNKQAIFTVLIFLSLFALMIKILVSGFFRANLNKTHLAVLIFFIVYLFATVASLDKYSSFWGYPRTTTESLLSLAGFVIMYLLISNTFSRKEILKSLLIFLISSAVAILYGLLQLFGWFIIPFGAMKNTAFNTIGMVSTLGFFTAVLFPVLMIFAIRGKLWQKITAFSGMALSLLLFVVINYSAIWWTVLISAAVTILILMAKKEIFDFRWVSVPMFFLVLALFFLVLQPQISVKQRPIEVFLNQSSSFGIAVNSIQNSPILGSGPATFVYDFSKYRSQDFNNSSLWNLRFDSAASKFLTLLTTIGILGVVSFIVLVLMVIISTISYIYSASFNQEKKTDNYFWGVLCLGIFGMFIAQTIGYFLLASSFSLDFMYFFLIACLIGLITHEKKKEYTLAPSSFLTLGTTFLFTLFFIFGLGILILGGQRYFAEVNYYQGAVAFAAGDAQKGLKKIETAANLNPNADVYLTELSQIYLSKIASEVNRTDLSDEDKTKNVELLINNSVNAANIAKDKNPNNVGNWSVRGYVYQNLIGTGIDGMTDLAVSSYDEAIKREPTNPYYLTQQGVSYLTQAAVYEKNNKIDEKNKSLENAKAKIDEAIKLKSDYASARYQLAMVYAAQGKTSEQFKTLEETKKYSPNDVGLAFQIGVLYYQKGDYQNAKLELERAVSLNNSYANALYFLSLSYYKLGQNEKAIQAMQKVLDLNPNNADVKTALENLKAGKAPVASLSDQTPIEEAPSDTKTNTETKK